MLKPEQLIERIAPSEAEKRAVRLGLLFFIASAVLSCQNLSHAVTWFVIGFLSCVFYPSRSENEE